MHHNESVTEDDVVLAFVKAEIDSPLYGPIYQTQLLNLSASRESLIDNADLSDQPQNDLRKTLLRGARGYPDQFLFNNFPRDTVWRRVRLEPNEIVALKNGRFDNWIELTKGSRSVAQGAAEIASGVAARSANAAIRKIAREVKEVAEKVRAGHKFPELIVVQASDGSLILLEGNTRATAYVLAEKSEPTEVFVGSSAQMRFWDWY
jgi:hypothetical protein